MTYIVSIIIFIFINLLNKIDIHIKHKKNIERVKYFINQNLFLKFSFKYLLIFNAHFNVNSELLLYI